MKSRHWRLFPKYATLIIALVGGVLIVSGAVSLMFSWRAISGHLVALQTEKAQGAATRIEQYILDIEHQLGWTAFPSMDPAANPVQPRRIEYIKLLRQVPAVTELVWVGPDGRERLRVSRLAMEAVDAGTDLSREPAVLAVKGGKTYFGPVNFRKGTEPYMTIARPAGGDGGVTMADVNLKFVWDVVSRLKIGVAGVAYVVDAGGTLIAHPDISLVLKKTDLRALPQVAALDRPDVAVTEARNLAGDEVFAAHARIPSLRWTVLAETPRSEAFAPLYDSVIRLGLLLVAALGVAAAASFFLARALVRPIRALQEGAARIGAGELEQRIGVKTGDELEALAEQFNKMGSDLQASYAGLERKVEERTAELTESLEQQTATAEVLQVISRSPTDVQPVFDIISERAMHLCDARYGFVFTFDGEWIEVAGACGLDPVGLASFRGVFPMRPDARAVVARTIREGVVINAPDVLADVDYPLRDAAERAGFKSALGVPMRREGQIVGAITVTRSQTGRFPDKQVRLLETFADQAVIAIENVRLFNETKTALDRQTATSEILQVIGSSVADTAPVFEKILDSCQHLFATDQLGIFVTRDDALLHIAAWRGSALEAVSGTFPKPLDQTAGGLAIRERRTVHYASIDGIPDIPPAMREVAQRIGDFSAACAPMLWKDSGVGSIAVQRQPPRPFSADELALLKTFADQAAIAIQNARLFNETKEALEKQTATSEVLEAISSSPTSTAPVFEAIAHRSMRLCAADYGFVFTFDGQWIQLGFQLGVSTEGTQAIASHFPMRPDGNSVTARAIASGDVVNAADVLAEPGYQLTGAARAAQYRAALAVPMKRQGQVVGAITVARVGVGEFPAREVDLLKTFADQAVIAIENVRLFNETKEALDQQTAISDILRAISESPADVKPVLDAIADRAARLCDAASASIYLTEGDQLRHVASQGRLADQSASIDLLPINRHSTSGRAVLERTTIQVADLLAEADQYPIGQEIAKRIGHRSLVVTPLFREGQPFGTILLRRQEVRPFSEREVALLRTFGDQAAIALENTRLFHEIQDKSRQLEAANRHKSEFLANMSHELRTPLNAIIGFSEVLTEQMFGDLNDKQMEYLRDIHSSGEHLLTLINDVLDLSKIEAGKMELDLSCFDLGLLLEHSTTLVRERAQRHGLTLTLEVGEGLGEWVGDARKLKQAVINLLSNAVKFTPAGGRVTLRARHLNGFSGRAGEWAEVSVIDNGIGIKPEDQALVFEEFRQASGDVLRKSEGTGLGLALVKRFAELHGGQVVLTSAPGQGSTFTITLPQHELKVLQ